MCRNGAIARVMYPPGKRLLKTFRTHAFTGLALLACFGIMTYDYCSPPHMCVLSCDLFPAGLKSLCTLARRLLTCKYRHTPSHNTLFGSRPRTDIHYGMVDNISSTAIIRPSSSPIKVGLHGVTKRAATMPSCLIPTFHLLHLPH